MSINDEFSREFEWAKANTQLFINDELAWAACYFLMPGPMTVRFRDWGEDIHDILIHPEDFFKRSGLNAMFKTRNSKDRIDQIIAACDLLMAEMKRLSSDVDENTEDDSE